MPFDRKAISLIFILILCATVAGVLIGSSLLPNFIEKKARQAVLQETPFSGLEMDVRHAGFFSTEINEIVVRGAEQHALSIGSLNVTYSPTGLLQKKIQQIDVNGLTVYLVMTDGKLSMPGLERDALQSKEEKAPAKINIPIDLGKVQVRNGILNLAVDGNRILIPFELSIEQKEPGKKEQYIATLHIFPRGEELAVTADLDIAENRVKLQVSSASLHLDKFADLVGKASAVTFSGRAAIAAQSDIILQPLALHAAELDITLQNFTGNIGNITIGGPKTGADQGPVQLSLIGNDRKLQYSLQNISLTAPVNAMFHAAGSMALAAGKMTGTGELALNITELPAMPLKDPVQITGTAVYGYDSSTGEWLVNLTNSKSKSRPTINLQYQEARIASGYPSFKVSGQGIKDAGSMTIAATLPKLAIHQNELAATLNLALNGQASMQSAGKNGAGKNGAAKIQAKGYLEILHGTVRDKSAALMVQDIKGKIPWHWPASGTTTKGRLTATKMSWKKNDLGTFKADISLQDTTYFLNGRYTSSLLQGLTLDVTGNTALSGAGFAGQLTIKTDAAPFATGNLGRFNPSLDKTFLNGRLGMDGTFIFDRRGLHGQLQVDMKDGVLELTENEYMIDGLGLSVHLPDLPGLRSSPAQQLFFNKASIGNLTITDGRVAWKLESAEALFIEESVVHWAGGRIYANGVRVSTATKKLNIPLFCDRLKLTDILQQFGVANAEGEGTVSGRIPLLLDKNTIEFADGFLYSSPGQGGSVKVTAFDLLTAGIPKNSPQFAQVDFATEALKNFKYNWVKLFLETTGEDLVMQMQMDGRPVQSLPFSYDSKTGALSRLAGNQKGIDQPIRLDVNFRFPLNRFLGYSGKIKDLMKKIQ